MKRGLSKVAFFLFLSVSLVETPLSFSADYLTASGCSVSNIGYLTELAKEYERRSGVKVFVRGGGSVVGIEDLRSGKVDFAASCRSREKGDPNDVDFIQVAWDALVFIVHKSNPVRNMSLENARAIYAGRMTNWKELKGGDMAIKLFVSRPRQGLSGVEASTRQMILEGKNPAETPNTFVVASTGIVEQMVENTPEGFATTGFTSARKREVRMLKVDGVSPSVKNIVQGKYPLKRPLFILVPRQSKPAVTRFVDFALSKEGQTFIRSQGVVSLLDMK